MSKTKIETENQRIKREKRLQKKQDRKNKALKKARIHAYRKETKRLLRIEKQQQRAEKLFKPVEKELSEKQQIALLAKKQRRPDSWLNLDNAALIFPAAENADVSNMFRLSVLMKEPVKPVILQRALNEIIPRFPSITSAVKKGLFWYYLEPSNKALVVEEQTDFPSRKIPVDARHSLIRVTYFSHEISVEFFHSATDGTGGTTFLNSLVATYLSFCGCTDEGNENCLDYRDRPRPEELVDSFQTCFDKSVKGGNNSPRAYNFRMRRLPTTTLILVKGIVKGKELHSIAKSFGATVTELLTGVYIQAFLKTMELYGKKEGKDPIVISVPVNLRKLYPSKTVRNFVSLMSIKHKEGSTLEEIIEDCKTQFKEQYNKEFFDKLVGYNVWGQHFFLIKLAPLPIKRLAMKFLSAMYGDKVRTSTLSNLGNVVTPKYFEKYIERYEFSLGSQVREGVDLTCASFNGVCTMTFSKTTAESDVERYFFKMLSDLGANIAVETNFDPKNA